MIKSWRDDRLPQAHAVSLSIGSLTRGNEPIRIDNLVTVRGHEKGSRAQGIWSMTNWGRVARSGAAHFPTSLIGGSAREDERKSVGGIQQRRRFLVQ
jgi:hypothetical protein